MGALKIQKFLGEAPKLASENLPETAATFAYNVKLYSGDMIPYFEPTEIAPFAKAGPILTIHPMDDGVGGFKWLHWDKDVDVATTSNSTNLTQRTYYTGDSEPRVTDYDLATTGGGTAYPYAFYTLGLPAPLVAPTVVVTSFATLTSASRARDSGNTATITFAAPHGLVNGAYVTNATFGGTGYNLTNAQITVTSPTTFNFYCPGAAETTTADVAGRVTLAGNTLTRTYVYTWFTAWGEESVISPVSTTVYLKEGQTVALSDLPAAWPGSYTGTYQTTGMKCRIYRTVTSTSLTRYYKVADVDLGTTTYSDTVPTRDLVTMLPSEFYDQPASNMQGIKSIHNNMMVGFYGNTVAFSEPGSPHAWPIKYEQNVDETIVGIGNVGQTVVVLTTGNPWVFQGASPATMSKTRMDYNLPCTSKRGISNMGYGLVFPTRGGLAMYSSTTGGELATKHVHDWDTWRMDVDPTDILATQYNGKYIATHSKGSFIFEKHDQIGGFLVQLSQVFTALYYESNTAVLYYAHEDKLYQWDDPAKPYGSFDWKSKTLVTKDYMNLGAARVIADYGSTPNDVAIAEANAQTLADNQAKITAELTLGAIGGASFGSVTFASDTLEKLLPFDSGVQFQLYVDKELIFTTQVADKEIFRLPTGYRSDTFEVRLTGNTRVRAVHLGETPYGLEKV